MWITGRRVRGHEIEFIQKVVLFPFFRFKNKKVPRSPFPPKKKEITQKKNSPKMFGQEKTKKETKSRPFFFYFFWVVV